MRFIALLIGVWFMLVFTAIIVAFATIGTIIVYWDWSNKKHTKAT